MNLIVITLASVFLATGDAKPESSTFEPLNTPIAEVQFSNPDITMMDRYERYLPEPGFQYFPERDA